MPETTTVMFACRQNAGRSQIAAALMKAKGGERVKVLSAGTTPADELHPETLTVLGEMGLEPISSVPQFLEPEDVEASDWVITMGCGETCPIFPGVRYEDWDVEDPSSQPIHKVREIRDDIEARVDDLLARL